MATLSVVSCKYDGEHLIAKLKVEVLDIKNTENWMNRKREVLGDLLGKSYSFIRSNELTIFLPITNISFKYSVNFFREGIDGHIKVTYNDQKSLDNFSISETSLNNYVKEFEIKEKITLKIENEECNALVDDLRKYSNFTIYCKTKPFSVNIAILLVRSPVFCAMISTNFKEALENKVEINDFEPEIVEKMIEFCETDEIKETVDHEPELYKIARKYQIESFMIYTRKLLMFTTTFDNSCEYLKLSKIYSDDKLTDFLLSWIRPNIQHICKTQGFMAMSDEEIAGIFR